MRVPSISVVLALLVPLITLTDAIALDTNNVTNIKYSASLIATGLMDYYQGDQFGGTVGMFTWPYYWWEAGGAWGSMIDYGYYMENDTYTPTILAALQYQVGADYNYVPVNQSTTEGNDDQGFWGIAVMGATEKNFTNPEDPKMAWLSLTQAVFNSMQARWDDAECGGGLRWQIFQWNSGYDYKNSVSNGCLFHIGARLARYTANDSYVDWAEKVWDWMVALELLVVVQEKWWFVYDGVNVANNCTNITRLQWSYNQGLFLSGAAYLYNYTGDELWLNRTKSLLTGAEVFFNHSVMFEVACQGAKTCNQDQRSFKAYLSRFLGLTSKMVPALEPIITPLLVSSANAAAWGSCTGGTDGHTCGLNWMNGVWNGQEFANSTWDGYYGLGEQMGGLEVIVNLRVHDFDAPYTANVGGSSLANPDGGYTVTNYATPLKLGTKDVAGAAVITALIGVSLIASGIWLIL